MRRGLGAIALAGAITALINGCFMHRLTGPRLTGTCDGACHHYVECKSGHHDADRQRCVAECPEVFSDEDSLMAFESLTCKDAVEYVDGTHNQTASAAHR